MAALRAVVGALAVVVSVATASTASATSLEDCAQRVIRDWYSGGRVDGVYPLSCYRAAIKALPSDVLQYSDADRVIASALANARQDKRDAARAAAREQGREQDEATTRAVEPPVQPEATREPEPTATRELEPTPKRTAPAPAPIRPEPDIPRRLASGVQPATGDTAVPYPVIALATLAGVLLVSAAAGWLARRRP
jgi:hypothetical protein